MKYLLGGVLFIASFFVGRIIAAKYVEKVAFLQQYRSFLSFAKGEIGFFRRKIGEIVDAYKTDKSDAFAKYISEYPNLSERNSEEKAVKDFFTKVKDVDSETIRSLVEYEMARTDEKIVVADKNAGQNGSLAKKLCPLFGVALFLMVM